MKNKILFFLKSNWLLVWIIVAFSVISLTVFSTYDISNSVMQKVIVASDGKTTGFTSNLMDAAITSGNYVSRSVYRPEVIAKRYETEFVVRNYHPDYPDNPYDRDIKYTLSATIVDKTTGNPVVDLTGFGDQTGKKIEILDEDGNSLITLPYNNIATGSSAEQTITYVRGLPGDKKYKVVFENWDINETAYGVKLEAKLTNGATAYPDLTDLGCVLGIKKNPEYEQSGWNAYLNEERQVISGTFDGYNIVLAGSGRANIKIRWDTSKISLNTLFRGTEPVFDLKTGEVDYTAPTSPNTWATLTVHADSSSAALDYRNYYNIQFYGTGVQRITNNDFKVLTPEDHDATGKLITVSVVNN